MTLKYSIPSYHIHIYYSAETKESAIRIRNEIYELLGDKENCHIGIMHDEPVGPHTAPMFRVAIDKLYLRAMIDYILIQATEHSILIHPETGNDLNDHTVHAIWIRGEVKLNLDKL